MTPPPALRALTLGLALAASLGACATDDATDTEQTSQAVSVTHAYPGHVAPGSTWATHTFEVTAPATIAVTLRWPTTSADLNLFLRDPDGTLIAYSNGDDHPEVVRHAATVSGTYTIGIAAHRGGSDYTATAVVSHRATQFGESLAFGVASALDRFGRIPVARVFLDKRLPAAWDDAGLLAALPSGTDVVITFKPAAYGSSAEDGLRNLAAGAADADIASLLESRPPGTHVWFGLLHEPEDDRERGEISIPAYRAAWSRVGAAVHALGDPQLTTALVLQRYTLNPGSGRDWHDYYVAGAADLIAWDSYNPSWDHAPTPGYLDPTGVIDPILAVSRETGTPWAIGELGSPLIAGDAGAGRAAWLTTFGARAKAAHATFVLYWDQHARDPLGPDFSLHDPRSIAAWRALSAAP